jgi:hypothetical protein
MKNKAKTYSADIWTGVYTVTVSFESKEDKEALLDYIKINLPEYNKLPEYILNRLSVEEVCNLLGKKLSELEKVANKLKEIK